MLFPSILLTTTLLSLPFLIHSTSLLCAGNLYGKPKLSDTITLGGYLPYVKSDPEGNMNAGRTFAEPAFFDPKFQGLMNTRDTSMVQLPLVWRFRKFLCPSSPRWKQRAISEQERKKVALGYCNNER